MSDVSLDLYTREALLNALDNNKTLLSEYFDLTKTNFHSKIKFDLTRWKNDLISLALSHHETYGPHLVELIKQDKEAREMVRKIAKKELRDFFGKPNKQALKKQEGARLAIQSPSIQSESSSFKDAPKAVFFTQKTAQPVPVAYQRGSNLTALSGKR